MNDRDEELARLVKELQDILGDEPTEETGPAFDDPEKIHTPEQPMVYCNYSNDYGNDLQEFADNGGQTPQQNKSQIILALVLAVSGLIFLAVGLLMYLGGSAG